MSLCKMSLLEQEPEEMLNKIVDSFTTIRRKILTDKVSRIALIVYFRKRAVREFIGELKRFRKRLILIDLLLTSLISNNSYHVFDISISEEFR